LEPGEGLLHWRVWVPPPQDAEQLDHAPQPPSAFFGEGRIGRKKNKRLRERLLDQYLNTFNRLPRQPLPEYDGPEVQPLPIVEHVDDDV